MQFLNLDTTDIVGRWILCCGKIALCILGCVQHLWLIPNRCTCVHHAFPSPVKKTKNVSRHCQMSSGVGMQNHPWLRTTQSVSSNSLSPQMRKKVWDLLWVPKLVEKLATEPITSQNSYFRIFIIPLWCDIERLLLALCELTSLN